MYSTTLSLTSRYFGVGRQRHAPAGLPPGNDLVPIVWEAGWAPGTVWKGEENLAPTGIQSSDRPARSKSLYRLRSFTSTISFGVLWPLLNPYQFTWNTQAANGSRSVYGCVQNGTNKKVGTHHIVFASSNNIPSNIQWRHSKGVAWNVCQTSSSYSMTLPGAFPTLAKSDYYYYMGVQTFNGKGLL
jgi:hypothetical protein